MFNGHSHVHCTKDLIEIDNLDRTYVFCNEIVRWVWVVTRFNDTYVDLTEIQMVKYKLS